LRLTKRVIPYSYESLYSFTARETKENYLSPLQLWNCCKAARLITLSDTYTLIFCPENLIDIKKLADLTSLTESRLFEMTFYNLLMKFKGNNASRARLMSGLLRKEYYYCPRCLQERPHHSLLWSLNDIHICGKHHSQLFDRCIYCGKAIQLIEVVNFSHCPYCGGDLRHFDLYEETVNRKEQEWRLKNYEFLLKDNNVYVDRIELAIKLLFFLNKNKPIFDRRVVCDSLNEEIAKLPTLLQHARNTLSQKRMLELQFLMNILYRADVSIEQFLNITVPKEFRISITEKKQLIKDTLSCTAPWCRHYGISGTLIKTGTSFKKKKDGSLKYYLVCESCGCQYALDSDNNLIERTNYIRLYTFLKTVKCKTVSLRALSRISNFPIDELLRALSYFDSRHVFCLEPYHVESDQRKVSAFIQAIHSGEKIKNIHSWKIWCSYYEYLFYRYHQEVLSAEIEDKRMNPQCLVAECYLSELSRFWKPCCIMVRI